MAGIRIGINARLFANNWRPARDEIEFARAHGFQTIQFRTPEDGLGERQLGDPLSTVARTLQDAGLTVAMEMVLWLDAAGHTAAGATLLDALTANLPAITTLPCQHVHWHFAPFAGLDEQAVRALAEGLRSQFVAGVALAEKHGFQLAFEHNDPGPLLLDTPDACRALLEVVPGLGLVWDVNHTIPAHVPGFQALLPWVTMLHVADTPLPDTNHHLPLGQGSIDWPGYCGALLAAGFQGPAILEIGGLPKSGGVGRDTDEALLDSYRRLSEAIGAAHLNRRQHG